MGPFRFSRNGFSLSYGVSLGDVAKGRPVSVCLVDAPILNPG